MSIFVALHHVTHYKYDRPIDLGPQTIRLRPAPHTRTPILSYSLKVTPSNHFVNWQQDPQGNWLAALSPTRPPSSRSKSISGAMTVINPFDFFVDLYADSFPFAIPTISRPNSRHISRPSSQGRCLRNIWPTFRARRPAR